MPGAVGSESATEILAPNCRSKALLKSGLWCAQMPGCVNDNKSFLCQHKSLFPLLTRPHPLASLRYGCLYLVYIMSLLTAKIFNLPYANVNLNLPFSGILNGILPSFLLCTCPKQVFISECRWHLFPAMPSGGERTVGSCRIILIPLHATALLFSLFPLISLVLYPFSHPIQSLCGTQLKQGKYMEIYQKPLEKSIRLCHMYTLLSTLSELKQIS